MWCCCFSCLEPIVGKSWKVGPLAPPLLQATFKMQALWWSLLLAFTRMLTVVSCTEPCIGARTCNCTYVGYNIPRHLHSITNSRSITNSIALRGLRASWWRTLSKGRGFWPEARTPWKVWQWRLSWRSQFSWCESLLPPPLPPATTIIMALWLRQRTNDKDNHTVAI